MLPGPIFRREVRAASRVRILFGFRTFTALTIALPVVAVAWVLLYPPARAGVARTEAVRRYAACAFAIATGVEAALLAFLAAHAVGASIAEEREKGTLPLLLLTRLTRLELVATKLAGRLMPALLLIFTGLPVILGGAWIADLPVPLLLEVLAAVASTAAVAGGLGILASSGSGRAAAAGGQAVARTMIWLGLPLAGLIPVRSGTLVGDILVELRQLAVWVAPSSPLSLLTDPSWCSGPGSIAGPLRDRLATMMALQAALIALAMAGAVAGLRLREPHPTSWDPHRGYRPPVGDDPIFWREYDLPRRGSRRPTVIVLAHRLLIVIRALLLLALQAVFLVAAMAIALGLVLGTGWFAYFAFREYWGIDPPPAWAAGPRDHFNGFIRTVSAFLGLAAMVGAITVIDRIMIERHKKTWESLLTTPLTGREILTSKIRAITRSLWLAARWLVPLWLLGIVCGAVHPLGAALGAAGLAAGTGLNLALGIRIALRPGATTQSVASSTVLWTPALVAIGLVTVVVPLCSPRELDGLRSHDARLPWLLAAGLVAASLAMAALAWFLIRHCFERFDEWAGRPHRPLGPASRAGPGPVDRGAAVAEAPRTLPAAVVK
jgi:ABC-type Na+ efflux pump permease subunit